MERRGLGREDGIGNFNFVDTSSESGVRSMDILRKGAKMRRRLAKGMVGEVGAAAREAVLLMKKFA